MTSPAKLWIDALLSGNYKQTKGHLKTVMGHCCLGVLCEVYNETNIEKLNTGKYADIYFFERETAFLPEKVIKWLKWNTKGTIGAIEAFVNGLSIKNDHGVTFEEIAEEIRTFFGED